MKAVKLLSFNLTKSVEKSFASQNFKDDEVVNNSTLLAFLYYQLLVDKSADANVK